MPPAASSSSSSSSSSSPKRSSRRSSMTLTRMKKTAAAALLAVAAVFPVGGGSIDLATASTAAAPVAVASRSDVIDGSGDGDDDGDEGYFRNTYDPIISDDDDGVEGSLSSSGREEEDLPWGTINIVVVTDVHSWIAGDHEDDPRHWPRDDRRARFQDADYGDVLGFYRNLEEIVDRHNDDDDAETRSSSSSSKRDLFFVMNGDFVDGTGLSGFPPTHLLPLLHRMPWDAVNVGNHELYHNETIRYLAADGAEVQRRNEDSAAGATASTSSLWKKGGYLSSNTVLSTTTTTTTTNIGPDDGEGRPPPTPTPLTGHRYTYLEGRNSGATVLAFGFLFDFENGGDLSRTVPVETVVTQPWFREVLGGPDRRRFDAILVLAHMDCLHPLVRTVRDAIRSFLPPDERDETPIQFVTGHSHRRCHATLDPSADSFEAGRFLDTVGFVSFDVPGRRRLRLLVDDDDDDDRDSSSSSGGGPNFRHRFLDGTKRALRDALVRASAAASAADDDETTAPADSSRFREPGFGSEEGRALTEAIRSTRSALGLDELLGCSPATYGIFVDDDDDDEQRRSGIRDGSLWDLFLREVIPSQLLEPLLLRDGRAEPIFVAGSGLLRYSLFEGPVFVDDVVAVAPFGNVIHEVVVAAADDGESGGGATTTALLEGWRIAEWIDDANGKVTAVDRGIPRFLVSSLTTTTIDPDGTYRLLATDYDAAKLLSETAAANANRRDRDEPSSSAASAAGLFPYASRPVRRDDDDENDDGCYTLQGILEGCVRETMPCGDDVDDDDDDDDPLGWPLLRGGGSSSAEAGLVREPTSTTTRRDDDDEAGGVGLDQLASAILAAVVFVAIAYLLVVVPEAHRSPEAVTAAAVPEDYDDDDEPTTTASSSADVQLIPLLALRRRDTEASSSSSTSGGSGSYGSIG